MMLTIIMEYNKMYPDDNLSEKFLHRLHFPDGMHICIVAPGVCKESGLYTKLS